MGSVLHLRIDHQPGDILQVGREIWEKCLNVALAQLVGDHILRILNRRPVSRLNAVTMHNFVHVMHQVRQDIDSPF